jgi:hypothetical protein
MECAIDYVFKFLLTNCTTKESVEFIKNLLRRSELICRFKSAIDVCDKKFYENNFIQNFEEVPMKSIEKRQIHQLINKSPRSAVSMIEEPEILPIRVMKTPERKQSTTKQRRLTEYYLC